MSDTAVAVRPDCPSVPDDLQWYEMYQAELLCGKEGELCIYSNCTVAKLYMLDWRCYGKVVNFQKPQPGIHPTYFSL